MPGLSRKFATSRTFHGLFLPWLFRASSENSRWARVAVGIHATLTCYRSTDQTITPFLRHVNGGMAIVIPLRVFHSFVEGLVATVWNVIKFHQAVLYLWRNGSHKTRGGGPEVWFNYENVTEAGLKIRRLRWPFNSVAETRFIDILWAPCLACHAFSLPRTSHGRNYADRRNFHPGIVRNSFHSPAILSRREIVVTWEQKLARFDSTVDPFCFIMCTYRVSMMRPVRVSTTFQFFSVFHGR